MDRLDRLRLRSRRPLRGSCVVKTRTVLAPGLIAALVLSASGTGGSGSGDNAAATTLATSAGVSS